MTDIILSAEQEAREELAKDLRKQAVTKFKNKLMELNNAKRVVAEIEQQLEVIRRDMTIDANAIGAGNVPNNAEPKQGPKLVDPT